MTTKSEVVTWAMSIALFGVAGYMLETGRLDAVVDPWLLRKTPDMPITEKGFLATIDHPRELPDRLVEWVGTVTSLHAWKDRTDLTIELEPDISLSTVVPRPESEAEATMIGPYTALYAKLQFLKVGSVIVMEGTALPRTTDAGETYPFTLGNLR